MGGRDQHGRRGRGCRRTCGAGGGQGHHYTSKEKAIIAKGLCAALGNNIFDYGQKCSADQMRTSWEKLVQYVGANQGHNISNKLANKQMLIIAEPIFSAAILARHAKRETMVRTGQKNLRAAREVKMTALLAIVLGTVDIEAVAEAEMKIAILQNKIAIGDYETCVPVPVKLNESEKTLMSNEWRTHRDRTSNLSKHRGQTYNLILGQCTQLLHDRMKRDADWKTVSTSYDPLLLYRLIERTILAQTEDQYPFATVYDQEQGFYSFRQDNLTNAQWYKKFNMKIDVGNAIGITHQHKSLL